MDGRPAHEVHRVQSGPGDLYVRDYPGAGPTLVLMHGLPDHQGIYDDLIPHLVAANRRVVSFDFLGFGASDKPFDATYNFLQQQRDLEAVVQYLRLGRIVQVLHGASGILRL